ncbi:MAG: hydrogenase formation protein HypD, partial [Eubacteriales bacterium]|nr:hydrogenase formation protein HypD [Eubacteriales bacterium]
GIFPMTQEEKQSIGKIVTQINASIKSDINIMEVCGTHTHQIARFGIRKLLTPRIHLVSGPGCPICVTEPGYIDALIALLEHANVSVATFGDLLRVRGSSGSLEEQQSLGRKVITVYSPEDVLALAKKHKDEYIVLAAVGFETTAPLYAALLQTAQKEKIRNLLLLTSLKRMEPAIRFILGEVGVSVDGMLCPGHVAAITGIGPFLPVTTEYNIPAVICGFEAIDIIVSIGVLCKQITEAVPLQFVNTYKRCVRDIGNPAALRLINEVFRISDASWRGIGTIHGSALTLNNSYEEYDAYRKFNLITETTTAPFPDGCECGKILIGAKTPDVCQNFGCQCTPDHPIGPCMISSEGACAVYYRFGGGEI